MPQLEKSTGICGASGEVGSPVSFPLPLAFTEEEKEAQKEQVFHPRKLGTMELRQENQAGLARPWAPQGQGCLAGRSRFCARFCARPTTQLPGGGPALSRGLPRLPKA